MIVVDRLDDPAVAGRLKRGATAVILTDTLYGVAARAADEAAVERVYAVKGRTPSKPPIVLIASPEQLLSPPPAGYDAFLASVWPGPNSVIIPTPSAPTWLSRGTGTVAYRLPAGPPALLRLLKRTGPLIAPSANPEGLPPAPTIDEAIAYFGAEIDVYVDSGPAAATAPSALYRLDQAGRPERLR